MTKKSIAMSVIALAAAFALILGAAQPGKLLAYFTTYARAEGTVTLDLHHEEEIHEEFDSWTKRVTITSEEGCVPVFIRVKGFTASSYELEYKPSPAGSWVKGPGDFWYYTEILEESSSTTTLNIEINNVPKDNLRNGETFDVTVVYESTPVVFTLDSAGNSVPATAFNDPATWSRKVDRNTIKP